MEGKPDSILEAAREKVLLAINELAKGIKTVGFYPPGHPALNQAVGKIVSSIDDIPPPENGIEIEVTKNSLVYGGEPLPANSKAIADLNRELYYRRASKIILLPHQKPDEVVAFLTILNRDARDLQDEGGLERVLLRERVSRIWVNRVDYEGLTEMLKKEEEEPPPEKVEELKSTDLLSAQEDSPALEDPSIEELLQRLAKETDAAGYRDIIVSLTRATIQEPEDRRIEYSCRAIAIYAVHLETPPKGNPEIAKLAGMGIKELVSDDLVAHYIRRLRDRGVKNRKEMETILTAFGEHAVKALLAALAVEEDLLVRKTIVDIVTMIGPPAVPAILDNVNDSRWYVVRNMVTILGSLGIPELAPEIVATLSHPDLRVKKEAIKGLSKLAHPAAVKALGELCFFPEETIALTATAVLSLKKEEEAVKALYRRVAHKNLLYPHYRLAHEAIDSLRSIDTEDAITALEQILRTSVIWETGKFREMKKHALRSISRMSGSRPKEIVLQARNAPEPYLRFEAERILKKKGW